MCVKNSILSRCEAIGRCAAVLAAEAALEEEEEEEEEEEDGVHRGDVDAGEKEEEEEVQEQPQGGGGRRGGDGQRQQQQQEVGSAVLCSQPILVPLEPSLVVISNGVKILVALGCSNGCPFYHCFEHLLWR